jgi:DNA polymerase-3 subunit delta'
VTNTAEFLPPHRRSDFLPAPELDAQLARALKQGALANGWLIAGPEGVGKATLAYRLARALLHDGGSSLDPPAGSRAHALIAARAHPDLFVAERVYDEKKERHTAEIAVETSRSLIEFLSFTPSQGAWRVVIVDTADDLNRNSANALLKALEEPPAKTAIFVLSASPGRLLATIRSRCRRLTLHPYADDEVAAFLGKEGAATGAEADKIAAAAEGRPGFALKLALGDGAEAIDAVEEFLAAPDAAGVAQRMAPKAADGVWPIFQELLLRRIDRAARAAAVGADARAAEFVALRETVATLFARGDGVNLDRFQMVLAAARAVAAAPRLVGSLC